MCVWSAYTGSRPAAPLLWKTGCRIEHLWSGFYTGLLTLDHGKFHLGKCQGHSEYWTKEFSLEHFPGQIGFFHSRTGSGGDYRWAHPFIASNGQVALIAQGSKGIFASQEFHFLNVGNQLLAQNRTFQSGIRNPDNPKYITLANGEQVHVSEIVANAVEAEYERTRNPFQAIADTIQKLPEEAIFLFIFRDYPDTIYVGNVNQRAVVSFDRDGARLATCALAWGPPYPALLEIPPNSVSAVTPASLEIRRLFSGFPVDDTIPAGTLSAAVHFLETRGPATLARLTDKALASLFPPAGLQCRSTAAYRVLELLAAENRIAFEIVRYGSGRLAEIQLKATL